MSLEAEIVAAFVNTNLAMNVEALDHQSALYAKGKRMETLFTEGVDFLRSDFPVGIVRDLGAYIWEVVGNRHVAIALGPAVISLSFAAVRPQQGGEIRAMIFMPHSWVERINADPTYQLGAIVCVGSQAVDFYNGRFDQEASSVIRERAVAFEAAYLRPLDLSEPDKYQRGVLAAYPHGLGDLAYDRKPVEKMN